MAPINIGSPGYLLQNTPNLYKVRIQRDYGRVVAFEYGKKTNEYIVYQGHRR